MKLASPDQLDAMLITIESRAKMLQIDDDNQVIVLLPHDYQVLLVYAKILAKMYREGLVPNV